MKNEEKFEKRKIEGIAGEILEKLKDISGTDTILGEPIYSKNGRTIIPVSKASIGFVLGGGEYYNKEKKPIPFSFPLAGGSGGGVLLSPIGFLVEDKFGISFVACEQNESTEMLFKILKSTIEMFVSKKEQKDEI